VVANTGQFCGDCARGLQGAGLKPVFGEQKADSDLQEIRNPAYYIPDRIALKLVIPSFNQC